MTVPMMFRGLRSATSSSFLLLCLSIHISLSKHSPFRISQSQNHKLSDLKNHFHSWTHRSIHNNDDDVYDFDEYDPTPYGGGYDIHLTYGRPIEPSVETCYQVSSGVDETVDFDSLNYNSYSEVYAYADEVLENEYSSYSRPKAGGGRRRPSASGGPGPAYGFGEEEVERTRYGDGEEGYEREKYGDDGSDECQEDHYHHQEL